MIKICSRTYNMTQMYKELFDFATVALCLVLFRVVYLGGVGIMTEVIEVLPECKAQRKQHIINKVKEALKRISKYTPRVGVFGDAGVGKSSLCKVLFDKDITKINNVDGCEYELREILIGDKDHGGMIFVDVPGVGEDHQYHEEHINLYKKLTHQLDLVLWVIKADDKKYMSSIDFYKEVLEPNLENCPVVFAITQTDKIEPHRDWDLENGKPGARQAVNLQLKINDVSSRFNVSTNKIVPVSSADTYNLIELINKVVEMLPDNKNVFVMEDYEMQGMKLFII